MGFNRKNLLRKIIEIQEITKRHQAKGVTQKWIFSNLIEKNYHISERTYSTYLGIPAARELEKIKAKEAGG